MDRDETRANILFFSTPRGNDGDTYMLAVALLVVVYHQVETQ
jgi:hypothetical protein